MAGFTNTIIPQAGRVLIMRAIAGETTMTLTKLQMGDGELGSEASAAITALVSPLVDIDIQRYIRRDNYVIAQGQFSNTDLTSGFYWREIGLWAKDDDGNEVLLGYSNAGSLADYIASGGSNVITKVVALGVAVSGSASVQAIINTDLANATLDDLAKINDVIPLTHQKQSNIHLFTGLSRTGLVPVQFTAAADYNAGETLTIDSIRYTVALSSGDEPSGVVWKAGTRQLGLCDSESMTLIIISSKDNVPAHNVDPEAHPDIRALLSNHEGRITRLENMLVNEVTGNPFLVTFENLDGLIVTGTWNEAQARIEF